jgi:hypothetical protein
LSFPVGVRTIENPFGRSMAGITYLSTGAEFSFNPLSIDSEIIDVNEAN